MFFQFSVILVLKKILEIIDKVGLRRRNPKVRSFSPIGTHFNLYLAFNRSGSLIIPDWVTDDDEDPNVDVHYRDGDFSLP